MLSPITVECSHCGNVTRHEELLRHKAEVLFDEIEERKLFEDFEWVAYQCTTCQGLSLFGDFSQGGLATSPYPLLYPRGSRLEPEAHKVAGENRIPRRIVSIYDEVHGLQKRSPNAFVVQIRRALEFVCQDKGAEGRDLFSKLRDLVSKGVFPGYFGEMTDLLRKVGNVGAHADTNDVDLWDAELIDDFFRLVIEYVYVAPSKVERLKQRLAVRNLESE